VAPCVIPLLGTLFCAVLYATPAAATDRFVATVEGVVDGTAVELDTGDIARLSGVFVPSSVQPLAEQLILSVLGASGRARLEPAAGPRDRYRRRLVDLFTADDRWVQGLLVERGLAMAAPTAGHGRRTGELRALERGARDGRVGIWQTRQVIDADHAAAAVGRFALVRGEILSVGTTRNHVYLNFGSDYRTDFTLRIRAPELDHVLSRSAVEVDHLVGRLVEARGFALSAGGPLIELSHPEQIEVLR
jgi:micrococcal nuclease